MKRISFNDNWLCNNCPVTLPHDAMLAEKRGADAPAASASGFYYGGTYTYRKVFPRPEGETVLLEFEGVYRNPQVTVNGTELEAPAYGYIPFFQDITDLLREENEITVVADNSEQPDSRWYSGAGIYRPAWLWCGGKAYIKPQGIRVTTLSLAPARVRVEVDAVGGISQIEILDGQTIIATGTGPDAELTVPDAKLWSAETPHLYTCRVKLADGETVLDTAETTFGIRTITFSPGGLLVNGREVLLRGGCVHHDNGILGAATYDESEARRVRILKAAGYNAIRSAHNPTSRAMLEACDRMGMYLMDETWDMWYGKKSKYDYSNDFPTHWKQDLEALIARDYNHPSVILYSLGNEVAEPKEEKGIALLREMVDCVHKLDATRPATAGINLMLIWMASRGRGVYKEDGGRADQDASKKSTKPKKQNKSGSLFFNMITNIVGTNMNSMTKSKNIDRVTTPCLDALDIAGYNYASGRYAIEGKLHPSRLIFGSETFPQDIGKNWEMVKRCPYLVGDFMWTAWDYLGEAGIGAWTWDANSSSFDKSYPWLLADVGAIDILGTVLAPADYAKAVWGLSSAPAIHVRPVNHPGQALYKATWRGTNGRPSWSWQSCDGNPAVVEVYDSEAAAIRLELNGQALGTNRTKLYKAVFKTKYAPGTLTAVALAADGRELGRSNLVSAIGSLHLSVEPEEETASVGEIVYVPVSIVGANGIVESNADERLTVSVEGGELLGFGSANPCTTERFQSGSYTSYYGRALAVVRCGHSAGVRVTVKGETLSEVCTLISVS